MQNWHTKRGFQYQSTHPALWHSGSRMLDLTHAHQCLPNYSGNASANLFQNDGGERLHHHNLLHRLPSIMRCQVYPPLHQDKQQKFFQMRALHVATMKMTQCPTEPLKLGYKWPVATVLLFLSTRLLTLMLLLLLLLLPIIILTANYSLAVTKASPVVDM